MGSRAKGVVRIGTSGYQYDHWRGVFYPEDCPKKHWFDVFREHFDTVEINNSFYHVPKAETFDKWRERAPEGFLYVLKFSRYGTHQKKLLDPQNTIGYFLERASRLEHTLGPILVQLPPNLHCDVERLDRFLQAAPADHQWAVEFRHESWLCDDVYELLRSHNAALCVHDIIDDHPEATTADWVYLRFHGTNKKYGGSYSPQALTATAQKIKGHRDDGRDVFVYFNNDHHGFAVQNALDLKRYVSGK